MNRPPFLATILFLVLTTACSTTNAPAPSSPERELRRITDQTIAALVAGDVDWFQELLHDDYVATANDGRVIDRETFFATFSPPPAAMKPRFEVSQIRVYPHGDTAVMTARRSFRGEVGGREIRNLEQTTQVFRRTADGWKLLAEHSSKPVE